MTRLTFGLGVASAMAAFFTVEVMCRRTVGKHEESAAGANTGPVTGRLASFSFVQMRMQSWYHRGTQANKGQVARHVGCPANASLVSSEKGSSTGKYIFFDRDMAGFNNIKLQLESMVAIAAVSGRTLVLPSAGQNDHSSKKYFEFDFFDATNLTSTISVKLHKTPSKDVLKVQQMLNDVDVRKLDKERDWLFTVDNSRIQHFECLNLSQHDRAIAAHAVLHGLPFDRHFEKLATAGLTKLGLTSNGGKGGEAEFDCAHVRRGDFKSFAPAQYYLTDDKLSVKLQAMFSGKRPILVVSDEKPQLNLTSKILYSRDGYDSSTSDQTKVALDMIMCSRARDFVGSPMSTFTNGILELRRKNALLKGADMPATRLYAGEPEFQVQHGTCWNKQTTYAGIRSCEKGAPACFTACTDKM